MEPKKSKLKTCLWGCLIAFLVLIVLTVGTTYWLFKKGRFEPETTILAANSDFYIRAYFGSNDEVLTAFFLQRFREIQQMTPGMGQFPEIFQQYQEWKSRRDLKKLLPLELEFTGRMADKRFRGAVGFSMYNNLARIGFYFLERGVKSEGNLKKYGSRTYMQGDNGEFFIDLVKNVIYMAGSEEDMHGIYDSLDNQPQAGDARLGELDTSAPIHGFAVGEAVQELRREALEEIFKDGENADLWKSPEAEAFTAEVTRIAFHLHISDSDTLRGLFLIDAPPTKAGRDLLERSMSALKEDSDLKIESNVKEGAQGYRIEVLITGFDDLSLML